MHCFILLLSTAPVFAQTGSVKTSKPAVTTPSKAVTTPAKPATPSKAVTLQQNLPLREGCYYSVKTVTPPETTTPSKLLLPKTCYSKGYRQGERYERVKG